MVSEAIARSPIACRWRASGPRTRPRSSSAPARLGGRGPALLVPGPARVVGKPLGRALMTAALYWGGGHVLANRRLRRRTRARVGQITRALPDALDLMVVCL